MAEDAKEAAADEYASPWPWPPPEGRLIVAPEIADLAVCLARPVARGWLPLVVAEAVLTLTLCSVAEPACLLDVIAAAHGHLRQAVGSAAA